MTDEPQAQQPTPIAPPDLRLRGEHPRVTRLSRKVLIGLGAVSALAVAGAIGYALQTHNSTQSGQELLGTQNRPSAAGLAGLPKNYAELPHKAPPLGPPLPGDLGKPILNAGAASNTIGPTGTDTAAQRLAQEKEAARISKLFAHVDQQPHQGLPATVPVATATNNQSTPTPRVDAGAAQNMQDRKTAFLNAATDRRTVSPDRLQAKASPYVVQAGTVIPAALITGIRSDLPGQITAQVTEAVYDSPTGKYLLIPQGARLIGQYDSSVAFGQSRVLLVWTRLIMPDGTSIVLERLPGADTQGYAGLEDQVDYHWWQLAKAAVLSTILSVGAEAGTSDSENNLAQAIRMGASNSISQTGQQIVQRQLNIQPTLTIRPGFPVRIIVERDLVLAPYGQGGKP
ncbi:TrbI/VirB10 family protein [Acidiphilium multivorum]|uniref:TrbI/VirB10 family protein n=1 Tax=Acidiphilium multivorum TaxID=62140 RepID=UPI001B8BA65E|nr:TrbI/VirB10 family protein [Acidiphilium multivorum]MBS3025082.1 TrbI/VirB10 family protein [Acidiphilium multivorum]